jgi:hypothetical protein
MTRLIKSNSPHGDLCTEISLVDIKRQMRKQQAKDDAEVKKEG